MTVKERYRFETDCVHSDGPSIIDMVDRARRISASTFRDVIGSHNYTRLEARLGYTHTNLRLDRDYHVSFHRSTYRGKPCVYVQHSRIEYIFVET